MEFAGRNASDTNIMVSFAASFLAPSYANFGGKPGDIFIVFEISPKFDLGTRFLC